MLSENRQVGVGLPRGWDPDFGTYLEDAYSNGYPSMKDVNSSNSIRLGVLPSTVSNSHRITAATAWLKDKPANLTIITGVVVEKNVINKQNVTGG